MPTTAEKSRETRVRRMAERQRLRLMKSKRRDPRAWDYGGYRLVDPETNGLVFPANPANSGPWATLDAVEGYLGGER